VTICATNYRVQDSPIIGFKTVQLSGSRQYLGSDLKQGIFEGKKKSFLHNWNVNNIIEDDTATEVFKMQAGSSDIINHFSM